MKNNVISMKTYKILTAIPFHHRILPSELEASVASILFQSYPNFDLLLIQDGKCSLELKKVAIKFVEQDKRVKYVEFLENKGLAFALNYAIESNSEYDFFVRMDADDIARPDRLEKQLTFLHLNPEIGIIGGAINEFTAHPKDGRVRKMPRSHEKIVNSYHFLNPIIHPTAVIRRDVFEKVGVYDPNYFRTEDLELWGRAIGYGIKISNIDDVVLDFRLAGVFGRRSTFKGLQDQIRARHAHPPTKFSQKLILYFSLAYRLLPESLQRQLYYFLRSKASRI
jgi:glycosyltransferase involved in cell wall biosynthesis